MGFPTPLTEWFRGPLHDYLLDMLASGSTRRDYLHPRFSAESLIAQEPGFGRALWGLLSLEVWQQQYHDRSTHWEELRRRMTQPEVDAVAL